jgi:hypothetical protein
MATCSLAEKMRAKSMQNTKNKSVMLTFFEKEVKQDAIAKIDKRAEDGYFSANILEYNFNEYFKIDSNNNITRIPDFSERNGVYVHRIHSLVHSEEFQAHLKEYVDSLGMDVWCGWTKRGALNVITVNWQTPEMREKRKQEKQERTEMKPKQERPKTSDGEAAAPAAGAEAVDPQSIKAVFTDGKDDFKTVVKRGKKAAAV